MRRIVYLVCQLVSAIVILVGLVLLALSSLGILDNESLMIVGFVLFIAGVICFAVIGAIRKRARLKESGLTQEDYDFFYKSPSVYFIGALGTSIRLMKYEKRFKAIKALYDNQEYAKVVSETKKYYSSDDKIPPSLKTLFYSARSLTENKTE